MLGFDRWHRLLRLTREQASKKWSSRWRELPASARLFALKSVSTLDRDVCRLLLEACQAFFTLTEMVCEYVYLLLLLLVTRSYI